MVCGTNPLVSGSEVGEPTTVHLIYSKFRVTLQGLSPLVVIVTRGLKDLTEPWWLVRTGSESPASLTLSAVGSIFPVNGSVAGSFSEVTL